MGTDDRDSTQRQMDLSGDGGEASGSSGDDRGVGSIGNGDGGGAKKTLYLIDTSGFVFRAYHALPPFTNAQGLPTGAAYGFTNMLLGLLGEERPDYVAAVFDSGRAASFRREMYGEYKANRPKTPDDLVAQFPLVEKILDGFRVPHFVLESFEADDLIATLAEAARRAGFAVTVVSSDKDLMQLVGDDVRLLDTMKHRVYDRAAVREKFGVDPDKLGDWLALVGDSSDNVPGVPGVGAKTATTLLDAHGDLEAILAAAETIKGKKLSANLQEFADQARLSRRLVELQREAPFAFDLEALRRQDPDKDALWRLFEELGFGRLKSKLKLSAGPVDAGGGAEGMTVEGSADASAAGESFSPKPFDMIMDAAALAEVVEVIRGAGRFALALETTGTHPISAAIVGLGLSWGGSRDAYVPVGHRYLGAPAQLAEAAALRALMPLLSSPDVAVTVE
ncbi:MAG: hypothetical protein KAI47_08945, partial [Deltaproteobacteria bacterium]|nr:hypothetical protein [Deltaproteobacteria bacterium]